MKIQQPKDQTCLKEFQQYSWDDKTNDDVVIKENDHHLDALRYYVYGVARAYNVWVV